MYNVTERIHDSNIVVYKSVRFFDEELQKYKSKFNEYKLSGNIVKTKSFEENIWRLYDEVHNVQFKFELNELSFKSQKKLRNFNFEYQDLITAIKCFTLIMLNEYRISSVRQIKMAIDQILINTDYFNVNRLDDYIKVYSKSAKNPYFIQVVIDFLDYFEELKIDDAYYSFFEEELGRKYHTKNRLLPCFETLFNIAHIIDSFVENCEKESTNQDEKVNKESVLERFFPIVLWWYITTRMPLRVTEFTIIPYDCQKVIDNNYFLKLRRSMVKGNNKKENINIHTIEGTYNEEEFMIPKELYGLITKYKYMVDKYDYISDFYNDGNSAVGQRKFLLSYRSYYQMFSDDLHRAKAVELRESVDYLDIGKLRNLLIQFYSQIINPNSEYSIVEKREIKEYMDSDGNLPKQKRELAPNEIERIQLMDTRHMAIISMLLQDVPYVAIKELAGHKTIKTTFGYANQLERYLENYTYYISRRHDKQQYGNKQQGSSITYNTRAKTLYFLEKIESGEIKAEECNNSKGWCICKASECTYLPGCENGCNSYISKVEHLDYASKSIEVNKVAISSSIKVIQDIIKNRKIIKDYEVRIEAEMSKVKSYVEQNIKILKNRY